MLPLQPCPHGTRCAGSPLRKQDTGHVSYRWWGPLTRPLGLFCPYRGWQKGKCSEEWTREGGRVVKCRSKRFLPTLSPQPHPLAQTAKKFYLGIPRNRSCGDTCTAFGHLQYGWSPQPWRPEPLRATCLSLPQFSIPRLPCSWRMGRPWVRKEA